MLDIAPGLMAMHPYWDKGNDALIEDEEILSRHVDEVVCRWCGHGRSVVELAAEDHTLEEPGAPSKVP